jgi:hypothetical protein
LQGVARADIDGDGNEDLLVGRGDFLAISYGCGDGGFLSEVDVPAAAGNEHQVAADLDGDGRLDVIVTNFSGQLGFVFQLADGGFAPPATFSMGTNLTYLVAADLDGDHGIDIAAVDLQGTAYLLFNACP